jgi:MerR family mercuric resistance operon transcriptional regulator
MKAIHTEHARAFTIGELSRVTGVKVETIRYYEHLKILPAPPRTEGGRRVFGANEKRVLAFIRRGRTLGFTLEEIRTLLDLDVPGRASCAEVKEIASGHLEGVRARLADLTRLEAILAGAVARCRGGVAPSCPVLDILDDPQ